MSPPIFIAQEIGRTLVGDNTWLPTVAIDVSRSPEIADLARVHAIEGVGDVSTHLMRQDDSIVLGVRITVPVRVAFAVVFSYATHREFVNEVADAGTLTFATTSTLLASQEQQLWLSVDIDGDALRLNVE